MDNDITKALIESAGEILLGLVVLLAFLWAMIFHRKDLLKRMSKVSKVSLFGVEISLEVKDKMDRAIEERGTAIAVSQGDRQGALLRAQRVAAVLRGARILWVDDHPEQNRSLTEVLRKFGAAVDLATNTEEALKLSNRHGYDVIISDMRRGSDPSAGLDLRARLERDGLARWTVYYVGDLKVERVPGGVFDHPVTPPGALGITNRPDHLLHFVLDALERERWPLASGPVST